MTQYDSRARTRSGIVGAAGTRFGLESAASGCGSASLPGQEVVGSVPDGNLNRVNGSAVP